jgi:2-oxoglutarate ferredoxin oxidoreductase subunit beta
LSFIPSFEEISVEIAEGETREVALHDGSRIMLKKLGHDYDPTDRMLAVRTLHESAASNHVVTGLLYLDTTRPTLIDLMNLVDDPLSTLPESRVRPPKAALDAAMEELR